MIFPLTRYYFSTNENFENNILSLLKQIDKSKTVLNLVFFGNSEIQCYKNKSDIINNLVKNKFAELTPLTSFVVQPLDTFHKMGVEVQYLPESISKESLRYKKFEDIDYLIINSEFEKYLILEGILANNISDSIQTQSDSIFNKISTIFQIENIPIQNIVRQWNYIGNITSKTNGIQHYQAFNDSRSRFYSQTEWHNGYPAATGISMSIDLVLVSLIAISGNSELQIIPIDNSLQKPAYNYSNSVLVGRDIKTTPKFERAKLILDSQIGLCYISGTAAIRGEQSLKEINAALQTKQTIENILYLLSEKNLEINNFDKKIIYEIESVRVYIRNERDYGMVKTEVERFWKDKEVIYTFATICRDELLVEIEGIAKITLLSD